MELTFLGTRGEIALRSRRHRRHSSLLIVRDDARVMIDCGADWLGRLLAIAPTAILLTHAHRDHAAGLARGAPCPVYATEPTLQLLRRYFVDRRRMPLHGSITIGGLRFKAFPVPHSVRAPAVGYRVRADGICLIYLPDVADLSDAPEILHGVDFYIGDGATVRRPMVRTRNGELIGHASISTQIGWCESAKVHRAIFTHCGSSIVRGPDTKIDALVRQIGREHGIDARLAGDGDRLRLPQPKNAALMLKRPR